MPEVKVLFLISFFIVAGGILILAGSVLFFNVEKANKALDTFLNCESIPGTECDKSAFGAAYYPAQSLLDIGYVIILVFPAVNLVYVIEVQEIKRRFNNLLLALKFQV